VNTTPQFLKSVLSGSFHACVCFD